MKTTKIILASAIFTFCGTGLHAQGLFGKIKNKVGGGGGHRFEEYDEFSDEYDISGAYVSEGMEIKVGNYNKTTQESGLQFIKEEDGSVVNELKFHYWNKMGDDKSERMVMDEKLAKKDIYVFTKRFYLNTSEKYNIYKMWKVADGVMAFTKDPDKPEVMCVWAKSDSLLELYDNETAQAQVDLWVMQGNEEALKKKKEELMGYEVYKKYVGKMVFSDKLNAFEYRRYDVPTDKPKMFKKELEVGKQAFYKAYLEEPLVLSHPGAWYNMSYELNGIVNDREELRSQSRFFSKNISRKDKNQQYYTTWAITLLENTGGRVVWDYAFVDLLYKNKDKFEVGETYDLKVKIHAYKDGENVGTVSEGIVKLKYTENSKKILTSKDPNNPGILTKYEKWLNE